MTPITRLLTAAAAAASIATAGVAQAQPPGPGGQGGQQQPDLTSILHLRPEQQAAYTRYKAATQPSPEFVSRIRSSRQGLASLPTPARLDRVSTFYRLQMEQFQRVADATRTFYGQLSPEQQHAFDQMTAPPAGHGRSPQG